MRRFTLTSLLTGALVLPLAGPAAASPTAATAGPIGEVGVVIAGVALGEYTYPLQEGKAVSVKRHVLDPGEVIRWNTPETLIAMHGNEDGDLTNFPNCNSQQGWRAYPAYYVSRSKDAGTLTGVTANLSQVQIEFFTIESDAIGAQQRDDQLHREPTSPQAGDILAGEEPNPGGIGDPVTVANGCPSGPEGETTQLASGRMSADQSPEMIDHSQIVVYRHKVPAGYNSGWYAPYWPTTVIPVSGDISITHGCNEGKAQPVGQAFPAEGPILTTSGNGAEYLSISWGVQNAFPIDVPFYLPERPPFECPETALPL